jgi:hypothetical protein
MRLLQISEELDAAVELWCKFRSLEDVVVVSESTDESEFGMHGGGRGQDDTEGPTTRKVQEIVDDAVEQLKSYVNAVAGGTAIDQGQPRIRGQRSGIRTIEPRVCVEAGSDSVVGVLMVTPKLTVQTKNKYKATNWSPPKPTLCSEEMACRSTWRRFSESLLVYNHVK